MARQREQLKGVDAWEQLRYERKKRSTIEGICSAASSGDAECARDALEYVFEFIVEEPEKIPFPVRVWLERCLTDILNGEDPAQALNLKRKPHQREYPPVDYWRLFRDSQIARAVAYWRQEGMTREEAVSKVANEFDAFADKGGRVGYESVRQIYRRFFPRDL